MKKQKHTKMKFTWGTLTFDDPYRVIKEIFLFADLGFYRKFLKDVLLCCAANKQYREQPGDVVFRLEGIHCLLNAGYAISQEKKNSLLDVKDSDMLNKNFFTLAPLASKQFSDFPRALTKTEMLNPYKALCKIFKQHPPDKWLAKFKYLLDDACAKNADVFYENPLEVYLALSKLFEAAHLIQVREMGHIKNWR